MMPGDPAADGITPPAGFDADSATWVQSITTDPRDVGCAEAMDLLHVYAELAAADASAPERYPGIAAHLQACGPCGEDFDGLLAAMRSAAGFFDGADGAGVLSVTPA